MTLNGLNPCRFGHIIHVVKLHYFFNILYLYSYLGEGSLLVTGCKIWVYARQVCVFIMLHMLWNWFTLFFCLYEKWTRERSHFIVHFIATTIEKLFTFAFVLNHKIRIVSERLFQSLLENKKFWLTPYDLRQNTKSI